MLEKNISISASLSCDIIFKIKQTSIKFMATPSVGFVSEVDAVG